MPDVVHQPDQSRFAILLDGEDAELTYRRRPGRITFIHTGVPKAVQGQDLGTALVKAGLAFARENELTVDPLCPFVKAYMEQHPETQDLLASR